MGWRGDGDDKKLTYIQTESGTENKRNFLLSCRAPDRREASVVHVNRGCSSEQDNMNCNTAERILEVSCRIILTFVTSSAGKRLCPFVVLFFVVCLVLMILVLFAYGIC